VLLAPVTARAVVGLMVDGEIGAELRDFSPRRFAPAEVAP
jgi:hypothetical protein